MEMNAIEHLAKQFADANAALVNRGKALQRVIDKAHDEHLDAIRDAVRNYNDAQAALAEAIEDSPEMFEKPKTRTLHGVKFGFRKQPGQVIVEDEAKVIQRIRKMLPEEQQELMIRVREAVHKPSVYDLSTSDLKRLGITVTADTDVVTIKSADSAFDKFIKALKTDIEKRLES